MKNIKLIFLINLIFILLFFIMINVFSSLTPESSTESLVEKNNENNDFKHNDGDWAFFLINNENPLPAGYIPELETVYRGAKDFQLDYRCSAQVIEMFEEAKKDGINLVVCSAYRSVMKQEENFNEYVDYLVSNGYSKEQAVKSAQSQIASPGESEHNAGLALDIITENWFDTHNEVDESFADTEEFKWLVENSYKYGFILRYPKGREEITGFVYEPWHYRYIGIDYAEEIYYTGLTLEEYIENYSN